MKKNTTTAVKAPKDTTPFFKKEFGGFWFWAIIRIIVVLAMIFGAFIGGLCLEQINTMNWGLSEFAHVNTQNHYSCSRFTSPNIGRNTMIAPPSVPSSPAAQEMSILNTCMKDMKNILSGKTNEELDRAFIENMIAHHQTTIDMVESLSNGKHPELKKFGQEMVKTQKREIEQLKKWQKNWGYTQTGTLLMTGSIQGNQTGIIRMF